MILPLVFAATLVDAPKNLSLTLESGSLFKNGFAVLIRKAEIPESGEYVIKDIPQAGLGTFWVMTSRGCHLEFLRNEESSQEVERNAATLDEILSLNKGKDLEITFYGTQNPVNAQILSADGQVVLFKAGNDIRAINKGTITGIRSSAGLIYKTKDTAVTRVLHLKASTGEKATLSVLSLEKGLSWSPSYYVDITDPKALDMVARCTLLNDGADFKDASLRLVTGFPNFQHASSLDPMSFFQSILPANNVFQNQAYFGQAGGGFGGLAAPEAARSVINVADAFAGGALPGGGNEDLFYYDLPHVSLKRSDRAYQPLFDGKASYEHVYRLGIDESHAASNPNGNSNALEVWHTLEFVNPMSQPLTTAPALVVSKGEVLGQSTIDYTPAGAKVHLNLTKALDVLAEIHEEEVSRKRIQMSDRWTDEVIVKGTIRIENRKAIPVHLEIGKDLIGEVKEASDSGKPTKTSQGLSALNPKSAIQWDMTLAPYKTQELTYSYVIHI